jgi:NADH-quinone oxidoreductase subunit L
MVLACGVGAYAGGVFHLFTHACFKALLFLGAGSVIVAMHHKQDMQEMGGLRKYMPITHIVMLVGVLAIIGFPGLAGFFSKDEILWKAWIGGGPVIWGMGALAALCTAFYMTRLLMLTFYGPNRSDKHTREHLHETSWVMWAPLVVLAILSATVGYLNVPHVIPGLPHLVFEHYLAPVVQVPAAASEHWQHLTASYSHSLELLLMGISVLGMFLSAGLAVMLYKNGPSQVAVGLKKRFGRIHHVLTNKYFVDEFYFGYIVNPLKEMSLFLWKIVDTVIIDGIVNGIGQACMLVAGLTSFSMHRHAMVLVLGLFCMLTILLF